MATTEDPAVSRRKLKGELRAARAGAGLTREAVAEALDWSLSKLVRIETGDQGVSVTDLWAILQLYGVTDKTTVNELTEMARASRGQAWWASYRDVVSKQYGQLLGYEGSAAEIQTFHPFLIPGLLHTDDYAFELLRARIPAEAARRIVDLRTERQERLFEQSKPPQFRFLIGEEALYRWIGGPAVMRRQMRHLLEMGEKSTVSIRVIPFKAGSYPGLLGPLILLSLQDTGDHLLFLEGPGGDVASRDETEMIASFFEYFETMQAISLGEDATREVIDRRVREFAEASDSLPGKRAEPTE